MIGAISMRNKSIKFNTIYIVRFKYSKANLSDDSEANESNQEYALLDQSNMSASEPTGRHSLAF
jgi:hypothetical protein